MSSEMSQFQGQVNARRDDGEPLRPVSFAPEAVRFNEANHRIDKGNASDLAHMMIGGVGNSINKQLHVMAFGVNSVLQKERIGSGMQVRVPQRQQSTDGRKNQRPFDGFKERYGTQGNRGTVRPVINYKINVVSRSVRDMPFFGRK